MNTEPIVRFRELLAQAEQLATGPVEHLAKRHRNEFEFVCQARQFECRHCGEKRVLTQTGR